MPGAAGPAMPGVGRGGMALDLRRGKTSKEMLQIQWSYPVWKPKEPDQKDAHTVVVEREHALPREQAFAWISGDDRRPLLVLRECERCKGTDHALLSRDLNNEQTVLLTHWFHCVKLPTNVLDDEHPFHALFQREQENERIPHLFFASYDGSNLQALPGDQSQSELWSTMFAILDRDYDGDAKKNVKELRALLSQYDSLDAMEQDIKARLDKEIDKRGPDSPKVAKYERDLEELQADRDRLRNKEKKLRELTLEILKGKPAAATGG